MGRRRILSPPLWLPVLAALASCTPRQNAPGPEPGASPSASPAPLAKKVAQTPEPSPPPQSEPAPLPLALRKLRSLKDTPRWGEGAEASGKFGVVTSVEAQATRIGTSILEQGGNAVDAAVATAFALAVTHPSAGNIGGGGFLLLRLGSKLEAVDFREDSPRTLTEKRFWKMIGGGGKGPVSVGIPGTVAGLHLAHSRHGKLTWDQVVGPAENLARQGFQLGPRQANTIRWAQADLRKNLAAKKLFQLEGKSPPVPGSSLTNPGLALALERIRKHGPNGFYQGPTAADILRTLGTEGLISSNDLKSYRAKIRQPLAFDFQDFRVITMPAPSAGGVALTQNLLMLDALGVTNTPANTATRLHLIAETSRRSQVERQLFVVSPDELTEDERAAARKRALDPMTWLSSHPIDSGRATDPKTLHPKYKQALAEKENTTHFSVIDAQGGMVSCTVTLSGSFGARMVTRETGIVLNNSVASFSSMGANTPKPGQRTTSSMAPTLALLDQDSGLVLGSPGGDTIPNTVTQTFLALGLDNRSLKEAVAAPRIHQPFAPNTLAMERFAPLPQRTQTALRRLGHRPTLSRFTQGDANIAARFDGQSYAVSDKREGGLALASKKPGDPPSPEE